MNGYKLILIISILTLINLGCSKDDSSPIEIENPSTSIEKSEKRGLAYNLTNADDLTALKSGVSWWYNWYFKTDAPIGYYESYQMEFIPMLWGRNNSNDYTEIIDFILDHEEIEYLLVLNEPNLTDQANLTPYDAAVEWVKYEKVVTDLAAQNRTIYLVGPAMTWGTMTNYWDPIIWLDDFYTAYKSINNNREPKIDYLAFHWYDYGLEAQLDRLQKYGKKIWITEMANWNSQINTYAKQAEQMIQMVSLCETREDVFRYAWFIGRGNYPDNKHTYLFNPTPGELNDLGKLYISLPYQK
ncbi:MAG: glycosyl hydrolase [Melioribacteraceae bacterium]|nr:glycosyl hydrolase [Melioribacteraceae bacterium]